MKKVIGIAIFLILCICINTVYATTVTLNKMVTEIKKGEEITVNVAVNDVDTENGIDTLIATLNYDGSIFERAKRQNISAQNDWNSPSFREDTGKIIIQRDEPMKTNGTVFSITLKAKETATLGDSAISLSDINISDGDENYFPANVETTIGITEVLGNNDQESERPDGIEPTPSSTATPTPVATQKPITNTTKATPTPTAAQKPTVLPKAGDGVNILVAIPILLAVTVVTYIQIRKYKEI